MKSTFRFIAFAVLACASLVSATFGALREVAAATYRMAKDWIRGGFKLVARVEDAFARPAVAIVQAKAHAQALMKRERPVLTGSWRMCPSI
nr:hypothetical protein [uncultured Rhodoferax sp.]